MKTNNAYMHFSVMYADIYWGWRSFIFVKDLYAYLTKKFLDWSSNTITIKEYNQLRKTNFFVSERQIKNNIKLFQFYIFNNAF